MHPLVYPWQRLFAKHGFAVDLSQVNTPERKGKENLPLVWPREISGDDIAGVFRHVVENTLEFAAFVPRTISKQFDHVRDNQNGSYVVWVTSPVYREGGKPVSTYTPFCNPLTLPELYLYHIWMIEGFGKQYIEVLGSGTEHCRGTTYVKAPSKSPAICWDRQDIKVSFSHGFRDRET